MDETRDIKRLFKEVAEEVDTLDDMLTALVELLEEKGVVTQDEWEQRIKLKTARAGGTVNYRDIQFSDK